MIKNKSLVGCAVSKKGMFKIKGSLERKVGKLKISEARRTVAKNKVFLSLRKNISVKKTVNTGQV